MWRLAAQLCDRRRRRRSATVDGVTEETTVTGVDAAYAAQIGAVLLEFQSEVLYAVQELGWDGNDDVTESKLQWSFAGALLYAVTVITTIGIARNNFGNVEQFLLAPLLWQQFLYSWIRYLPDPKLLIILFLL